MPMIAMIGVQVAGRTNIKMTIRATKMAPSRNITDVIRAVKVPEHPAMAAGQAAQKKLGAHCAVAAGRVLLEAL